MEAVTLLGNHTARVEPGARLGHISVELFTKGRRAIPHGACPGYATKPNVFMLGLDSTTDI
jgi:hypothetical protein